MRMEEGDELMGYFITKLKLQVKLSVEKNARGFLKLVAITKEPFDSCLKCFSSVAVGERQVKFDIIYSEANLFR